MSDMLCWFESQPGVLQFYWGCAIVSSLFFLLQTVLTFVGMDSADADVDVDTLDAGGALSLFSVKNIVNFLLGFGWFGVSSHNVIGSSWGLALGSVAAGAFVVFMFLFLAKKMMKLETNGAFRIEDCLGCVADVYLRIPAAREGLGKVQIALHGSVHEIDAQTDGEAIPTGTKVRVHKVVAGSLLQVSPL